MSYALFSRKFGLESGEFDTILPPPMKPHDASTRHDPARYDVVGIGNAIVDVLARADYAFLAETAWPRAR